MLNALAGRLVRRFEVFYSCNALVFVHSFCSSTDTISPMCRSSGCSLTSRTRSWRTSSCFLLRYDQVFMWCGGQSWLLRAVLIKVSFALQVGHCYSEQLSTFPKELAELLLSYHTVLQPDLRMVRLCHYSEYRIQVHLYMWNSCFWIKFYDLCD